MFITGCNENSHLTQQRQTLNYIQQITSVEMDNIYKMNDDIETENNTIAIVLPSKILGKWAIDAINSAISYLLYKNTDFQIKVFDSIGENQQSVDNIFLKLKNENISKVLVLFTYDGAYKLSLVPNIDSYDIYLPLIEKKYLDLKMNSVIYGSINYATQFKNLRKYSNGYNVDFYDKSSLGKKLSSILDTSDINIVYKKEINNNNAKYKTFLTKKRLQNSTLIVNMPIVKSSIILSQISAKDITMNRILSTQLNYTPLLLSLTQARDRDKMIIANSISPINDIVEEYNSILNTDIIYNWVNYSTTIGIQYLINKDISSFKSISLENNQINYPVTLYKAMKFSFKKIDI
jgi:hypothetical protein